MPKPLKTFIIYAREDAVFKNELLRQLAPFAQNGLLEKWDDSHILPGEEWEKSIEKALEASHIVLMLVSADSLFSDFIQRKELKKALEQKREGVTRVIPILVRDCLYDMAEGIGDLQMLPLHPVSRSLTPVDDLAIWGSRASAWAAALRQLREVVNDVHARIEAEEKIQREQDEKLAALAAEAQREREAAETKKAEEAAKVLAAKEAKIQREKEAKAIAERKRIKDEATWKATIKLNTLEAYENYLDEGHTLHQDEAHQRIHDLIETETERKAEQKIKDKAAHKIEANKRSRFSIQSQQANENQDHKHRLVPRQKIEVEVKNQKFLEALEIIKQADPFYSRLVSIKGGTFKMGSIKREDEKPIHNVRVHDFQINKYLITQYDWKKIMGTNPSHFKGDDLPVESVTWDEIQDFLKKLNDIIPLSQKPYRLPTEAEWEYAARGGRSTKAYEFAGSNNLGEVGWYAENAAGRTKAVGKKEANEFGIFDMSGNVWEWCQDIWHENYKGAPDNSIAWDQSGFDGLRVVRGGAWNFNPLGCRNVSRNRGYADTRYQIVGFRIAR